MFKSITLLPFFLALAWTHSGWTQNPINGVIKDREGTPLAGATVIIKGSNTFTVADLDGQFSLQLQAKLTLPFTLRISSVGFNPQEIEIEALPTQNLEVILIDDNNLS
jgi:hypothetical protein